MEIKPMRKIASVSLAAFLLLGGNFGGKISDFAWAQNSQAPNSVQSGTASVSPAPDSSDNQPPADDSTLEDANNATAKSSVPIWLWGILGVLGLWNGALTFILWQNFNKSRAIRYEISQRLKGLEKTDGELNHRISRKFEDLRSQLSSYKKTLESIQVQAQSRSTKSDIYSIEPRVKPTNYGSSEPFVNQDYDYTPRSSHSSQPAPPASEPWDSIVKNYNISPQLLETYVVERVSESEESVKNRRENSAASVFLKSVNNYNYWIFAGEDRNYWVTPKSDLKITPMGFDTFQALFECPEYQPGSKIQIVKPAKVAQNSASGGWDLLEKGQVLFVQ
ncbi:MAG: hypothetical protein MH252_11395 [Thermosynechococcaceae cyanobacterium MS004]|nr:hypothetical protein [Thermosynechococcaceae cyanobacterium MS004]